MPSTGVHLGAIALVLVQALKGKTTSATNDLLRNAAWTSDSNCIDHAWESDAVRPFRCHGETNQQWELTSEGQLRSVWGKCLEYFDDQDRVAAVTCDNFRRQKWYATNGLLKPQGFRLSNGDWSMRVGFCIDSTQPDGHLILFGCHGDKSQQFSASFMPTACAEDVVQVGGTWGANRNCIDYDYSANVAAVYSCHGQWNQRWHFTGDDELRVGDSKCLEYSAQSDAVVVRDCAKTESQKWVVLDDGHVQPKAMPTKCLDASYTISRLALAACVSDKATQKFTSPILKPKFRDLLQVRGPWAPPKTCVDYAWGTDYAYVYNCHGQANQLWEFTNDEQIRTTENKCLEFDGDGLLRVSVRPCDSQRATQKWRPKPSGEIVPRGYFDSTNKWRMPAKCLDSALEDQKLQLWDCVDSALNQKFRSNAMPTRNRDLLFADGASSTAGSNCVRAVDSFVVVAKCGATREMLWEFTKDGTLVVDMGTGGSTLCLTASGGGGGTSSKLELATCTGGVSQKWERTASGTIALQAGAAGWGKCLDWKSLPTLSLVACGTSSSPVATQKFSSTIFTSVSSGALNTLFEKANTLTESVTADAFLTSKVLTAASDVVAEASRVLASSDTADVARATAFLQQFISKNENGTDLRVRPEALYITSDSAEFLLSLSILLQSADDSSGSASTAVLQAISPAIKTFSEQLFETRYDVLLDLVLRGDVNRVEAYTDGTLSDFNEVGGMLSAVCGLVTKSPAASTAAASMCRLASYYTLMDQFFQLKYRLIVEGARGLSETSLTMARSVAETFKTNQSLLTTDPLWKRLMTLLVFGAPYVDVLPATALARASRGDTFLPTFVLYKTLGNDKFMDELTPMVRFVSDQITSFHITNVLNLTASKDIDALEAYVSEPFNRYTVLNDTSSTGDFALVARYVVPLVCGDPARQALSLCQLEQVYTGLQSVLGFERARRSSVVSLEDVLEVDVRKKLDVIDQEKKQFEMISTLQEVANKIGTTVLSGMADLKKQIAASTAAIRSDIEAARKDMREAIGSVGQQLQSAIEQSTDLLYTQVGQQAASIRRDIFDSSQRLEQRLDDTGRAILGSIEQSKQELKYQIGAEAKRTRDHISAKTSELKDHMSKETQGLREFVDAKTNQVISVVREEGASTREVVNEATNQIVRVVREEGATTRAFVDVKTNEVKEVVRAEGATTRQFIDVKTNQIISTVREEGQATRAFVDEKGNQVIGVVKEEGAKTRTEVRSEGAKIREHIDVKTDEVKKVVLIDGAMTRLNANLNAVALKKYINSTGENVKKQVVKSQQAVADLTTKQFGQLSNNIEDVGKATESAVNKVTGSVNLGEVAAAASLDDCSNDMWAARSPFRLALNDYRITMGQLKDLFREPALDDANMGLGEYYGNFNAKPLDIVPSIFMYARNLYHLVQFDLAGAESSEWFPLKGRPNVFAQEYNQVSAVVRKLRNDQNYDLKSDYARVLKGEQVDIAPSSRWEDLRVSVKLPSGSDWDKVTRQIEMACAKPGADIVNTCAFYFKGKGRLTYYYVHGLLSGALDDLERVRVRYKEGATKRYSCRVATNAQQTKAPPSRRLRVLATMATNPNEPFYAMTYSSLVKVLLDYRLQEAADQFCKYYEFRNGGVAPPMCGTNAPGATRPYYSLSTIQAMRSWQPPVHPRITSRILLPTQPLVQSGTGRAYPFVDLAALAAGDSVTFDVPTWDLDWLKRYQWVPSNAKPETLASYYVESMRLYLPIEASGSSPPTSSLAVTVVAESSFQQSVTWQSTGRTYLLPPQRFQSDVTYNLPACGSSSRAINPYHESAECVSTTDRSSQICVIQETTENSPRLLPTLLSSWRLRADVDFNNTQFRLVQPLATAANATAAPVDFNLFGDVTLVRVAAASPRSSIDTKEDGGVKTRVTVASTCCASDEYRVLQSGVCTKCPENSVPALNGYTCTAK